MRELALKGCGRLGGGSQSECDGGHGDQGSGSFQLDTDPIDGVVVSRVQTGEGLTSVEEEAHGGACERGHRCFGLFQGTFAVDRRPRQPLRPTRRRPPAWPPPRWAPTLPAPPPRPTSPRQRHCRSRAATRPASWSSPSPRSVAHSWFSAGVAASPLVADPTAASPSSANGCRVGPRPEENTNEPRAPSTCSTTSTPPPEVTAPGVYRFPVLSSSPLQKGRSGLAVGELFDGFSGELAVWFPPRFNR